MMTVVSTMAVLLAEVGSGGRPLTQAAFVIVATCLGLTARESTNERPTGDPGTSSHALPVTTGAA
jgi:hypothetical protein